MWMLASRAQLGLTEVQLTSDWFETCPPITSQLLTFCKEDKIHGCLFLDLNVFLHLHHYHKISSKKESCTVGQRLL